MTQQKTRDEMLTELQGLGWSHEDKRRRVALVLDLVGDGAPVDKISAAAGVSPGAVTGLAAHAENHIGKIASLQ